MTASLQSLFDTLEATPDPNQRLPLLQRIVSKLYPTDPSRALTLVREAEALAREQRDQAALAKSLHLLGLCHQQRSSLEAAKEAFEQGLELSAALADTPLQVNIHRGLLQTAFRMGNMQRALEHGLQALELSQTVDDPALKALTHNDLGIVYGQLSSLQTALEHFKASLALLEQSEAPDLSKTLNNLGELHMQLDRPKQALDYFKRAASAFREKEDRQGEGIALGNVGRAYLSLGRAKRGLRFFNMSRDRLVSLEKNPYLGASYTKIGQAYTALEDYPRARDAYQQALTLQRAHHHEFISETLYGLGQLCIKQGNYQEALTALQEALTLTEKSGVKANQYGVHRLLSQAYEGLGNLELALAHFKRFHELKEAVRDEVNENRVNALLIQFEVETLRQEREVNARRHAELREAYNQLQTLNEQLEEKSHMLKRLSTEDVLTGLYNRRFFDERLANELRRAERYGHPLSVAIIDLDSFKQINDTLSHQVGDTVLQEIAVILLQNTRDSDIVARYGGEEFALLFPDIGLEQAVQACEKIRRAVAAYRWQQIHPDLAVTLSIGVSERSDGASGDSMLAAADRELYNAKRTGKNQVMPIFSARLSLT